jgi:hypothetical protein
MRSWLNTEICKSSTTEVLWIRRLSGARAGTHDAFGGLLGLDSARMNLGEWREPEIHQEPLDFPLHPFQAGVCPQP